MIPKRYIQLIGLIKANKDNKKEVYEIPARFGFLKNKMRKIVYFLTNYLLFITTFSNLFKVMLTTLNQKKP
jgi:hypothetical protein